MEHFLFIAFIVIGSLATIASILAAFVEKDGFYIMISAAPASLTWAAVQWYIIYLQTGGK